MTFYIVIAVLACLALGITMGFLYAKYSSAEERTALLSRRDVLEAKTQELKRRLDEQAAFMENQKDEIRAQFESQLRSQKEQSEKQKEELRQAYQQQLSQMREMQEKQMDHQSTLIREQINNVSEEILKKRSDELAAANSGQLSAILSPLQEKLRQMREASMRLSRPISNRPVRWASVPTAWRRPSLPRTRHRAISVSCGCTPCSRTWVSREGCNTRNR